MAKRSRTSKIVQPHALRYSRSLIMAPPGHGKTTFLGTAQDDERTYPMLLLDFEAGTESLVGLEIDIFPIHSWQDANEAYELLASDSAENDYQSVGIDSTSEWHRWALLQILARKGPGRKEPDLLEQGDYGIASTQMRRVLREFRDLPMHCFMAAHTQEKDEPRIGRVVVPDMTGKMSDEIAGLVSVVGYLAKAKDEDGEDMRVLLLHGYDKFRIKARSPWGKPVPEEIDDPDVTQLLDALGFE